MAPETGNDRVLQDEEECESVLVIFQHVTDTIVMFEELKKAMKEKDRLKSKAYATILTNYGGLNVELHGDRAPKTVYNFVQLAKQGYYDNVKFHRLIPGFMACFPFPLHARS